MTTNEIQHTHEQEFSTYIEARKHESVPVSVSTQLKLFNNFIVIIIVVEDIEIDFEFAKLALESITAFAIFGRILIACPMVDTKSSR